MQSVEATAWTGTEAFGRIVHNIFDACLVFDQDGRILYWNREAEHAFGWRQDEVAGRSFFETLLPRPSQPKYLAALKAFRENGQAGCLGHTQPLHILHKSGQLIELELTAVPLSIDHGALFFAFFHDLLKDRGLEQEITDSRHQLAMALAAADLGVVEWNPQTNRMWKNAKDLLLHTGDPHARLETIEDFFRCIHPEDLQKTREKLQAAIVEGTLQQVDYRVIWKNGEVHWVSARGTVLQDTEGHPGHLFGVTWDITASKQAEAQLVAERARSERVLESISDGFFALDNQYRFVYLNHRALQIMNRPKESLLGQVIWKAFKDVRGSLFERRYKEAKASGRAIEFEVYYPPLHIWVDVHVYPNQEGLSVFFSDVTERKRYEEALKQLSRRLQLAREEERKHVAREIHDDLGSALVALKMQINALLVANREARAHTIAAAEALSQQVDRAMQTMRRIIEDLRPSLLDTLGVWAALEWLVEQFERSSGIHASYRHTGPAPAIDADRALAIYRIVQEALNNVAKHAQASQVSVRIRNDSSIAISITDNGCGVPPARPGAESYGILGMKERAAYFGGNVTVRAAHPRGTQVIARFPVASQGTARKT